MNKLSQLKEKVKSVKLERRKTASILMMVLTALLFVAAVWGLFYVQHVRKVVVKGDSPYTLEEIMDAADVEYGEYLFSKDTEEMETNILEQLPYIREVRVRRLWFSRLELKIESDTPRYYMKLTENANDFFLLSKDLRVLENVSSVDSVKERGLVYLELPYYDLETCVPGKIVEYNADEKNGYVSEFLEFFNSAEYAEDISAVGLKSRFEGAYVDFYGKCRIIIGKPDIKNIEKQMALAYEALISANKGNEDFEGFVKIDVSCGDEALISYPESLD